MCHLYFFIIGNVMDKGVFFEEIFISSGRVKILFGVPVGIKILNYGYQSSLSLFLLFLKFH